MTAAVGLAFPGTLQDDSVLCHVCKNFAIELIIIEASFSMSAGWAIVKINGEEPEINKVFEYLRTKHIKIETIDTRSEE